MVGSERRGENGVMAIRLAALLISLTMTGVHAGEVVAPEPGCLSPAAVDRALREGQVLRLTKIAHRFEGEIIRAELCRAGEGLVYRVTLLDPRGSVRRVLVDGRTGRLVYDGR